MNLYAALPPAVRPAARRVRDWFRRSEDAAVIAEWRALNGRGRRFPTAGRTGGQAFVPPIVHRCRVDGVPTRLLIGTQEGAEWYRGADLLTHEAAAYRRFGLVGPGDTAFDLGANQGVTTLALARRVGPAGRVFAFDPFPFNCELIRINCRLNGVTNVTVVPVGLAERAGTLAVSGEGQSLAGGPAADPVTVAVDTLATYAHLRPDFVKMDIEGAEVSALSAAGALFDRRPNLYLEVHHAAIRRFGRRPEELAELLPTSGYRLAAGGNLPDQFWPLAEAVRGPAAGWGYVVLAR